MQICRDIFYSSDKRLEKRLDIYLPEKEPHSVFVYFHGGGLETGSRQCAEAFAPFLTEHSIAVVSADYRMYPKASYPDFIRDAAEAVSWVVGHPERCGGASRVFVGGSSAGAYLSMMLCFDDRYLSEAGVNPQQIQGYVHDAGQPTVHFRVLEERGMDPRRVVVDEAAPLFYVGTSERLAPMQILVSSEDMENRLEQTMLLRSTLRHFGAGEAQVNVKIMEGTHCAYTESDVFAKIVLDFIGRVHLKKV